MDGEEVGDQEWKGIKGVEDPPAYDALLASPPPHQPCLPKACLKPTP